MNGAIVALLLCLYTIGTTKAATPIPTNAQRWYQEAEIHALIHFNMATFFQDGDPGCQASNWDSSSKASSFAPSKLNISAWADIMVDLGAKGAILTAKHGCGHLLWPTKTKLPDGTPYLYAVGNDASFVKYDVLKEFQRAMGERDIGHGFYYSLTNNYFLNVHSHVAGTAQVPPLPGQYNVTQTEFEEIAFAQVSELWTNYGNLSEIWFDGGYTSDMKAKIVQLLERQPNAIAFGGYGVSKSPSSWIGTESGIPSCADGIWSTGTSSCGDPTSTDYVPKTCDTTLQNGDHWFWTPPSSSIRTIQELVEVYHATVGSNGVLELDFAIDRRGLVDAVHAARYREFGDWIRSCYGNPVANASTLAPSGPSKDGSWSWIAYPKTEHTIDRISIREDLRFGQRVQSFEVSATLDNGTFVSLTNGTSIGNRHIAVFREPIRVSRIVLAVKTTSDDSNAKPVLRQFSVFSDTPCGGSSKGSDCEDEAHTSIQSLSAIFRTLDCLEDILNETIKGWKMPAVVVFGGQSTGKSTLLERISGLPMFPRGRDMCTKLPIQIKLRYVRTGVEQAKITIMKRGRDGVYRVVRQFPAFDISRGESVIQEHMERIVAGQRDVSLDTYISLKISGPTYPNMELFDLPGLVAGRGVGEKTHMLSNAYLDMLKGRACVLLVRSAAGEDAWNSQALQLVKKRGNDFKKWTIVALTMCDKARSNPTDILATLKQEDGDKDTPRFERERVVCTASKPYARREETLAGFRAVTQRQRKNEAKLFFGDGCDEEEELEDGHITSSRFHEYLRTHRAQATTDSLVRKVQDLYRTFLCKNWLPRTLYRLNREFERLNRRRDHLGLPEWHEDRATNAKKLITKAVLYSDHIVPAVRRVVATSNDEAMTTIVKDIVGPLQRKVDSMVRACTRTAEVESTEFFKLTSLNRDSATSLYTKLTQVIGRTVKSIDAHLLLTATAFLQADKDEGSPITSVRVGRFLVFRRVLQQRLANTQTARVNKIITHIDADVRSAIARLDFKMNYDAGKAKVNWGPTFATDTVNLVVKHARRIFHSHLVEVLGQMTDADLHTVEDCNETRKQYIKKQGRIVEARRKLLALFPAMREAVMRNLSELEAVDLARSSFKVPKSFISNTMTHVDVRLRSISDVVTASSFAGNSLKVAFVDNAQKRITENAIFDGITLLRAFVAANGQMETDNEGLALILFNNECVRAIDEALEFALGNVVKGSVNSRGNLEVDVNYDGDDVPELGAPSLEPPKSCSGNGGGGRTVTQHSPKENPKTSR
eukprot:g548.t1